MTAWRVVSASLADAEVVLGWHEHLRASESLLYRADDHAAALDHLRKALAELIAAASWRLRQLSPPPPDVGQGDAPPLIERPVPKIVSANLHG